MLRIFAFGPNFVFRTNFVFATEFRLQRAAPSRISSSHEFRLQGRFSSSSFVFAHNLGFSSWRTISSSKASEFRLQGGTKPGPSFPGQCMRNRKAQSQLRWHSHARLHLVAALVRWSAEAANRQLRSQRDMSTRYPHVPSSLTAIVAKKRPLKQLLNDLWQCK